MLLLLAALTSLAPAAGVRIAFSPESAGESGHVLPFDNEFRELRLAIPRGVRTLSVTRLGDRATQLDRVSVEVGGRAVALSGLSPALRTRDLTLQELVEPLRLELAAPAPEGAILVVAARQEKVPPSGIPFTLGAPGYPPRAVDGTAYVVGSKRGVLAVDGSLDSNLESPLLRAETHPSSGHPDGWATAWVRDDGRDLYAALDFASDNTEDGGDDFAELWVRARGRKPVALRVTAVDARHGAVAMTTTPAASYRHKVYEFRAPLAALGAKRGEALQVSFAAYGTASAVGDFSAGLAEDGLSLTWRNNVASPQSASVRRWAFADGRWSKTNEIVTTDYWYNSWPDPTASSMIVAKSPGRFLLLEAKAGGSYTTIPLPESLNFPRASLARGGRTFAASQGNSSGVYTVTETGGTKAAGLPVLENARLSAAGDVLAFLPFSHPGSLVPVTLSTKDGLGAWSTPANIPAADDVVWNSVDGFELSSDGRWIAYCRKSDSKVALLHRNDAGVWAAEPAGGIPLFCTRVAVGPDGTILFVAGAQPTVSKGYGSLIIARPPSYTPEVLAPVDAVAAQVKDFSSLRLSNDGKGAAAIGAATYPALPRVYYFGPHALTFVNGASVPDQTSPGTSAPALSVALRGNPTDLVTVGAVSLSLSGSMDDAADVLKVHLFTDRDQDGTLSTGDTEFGTGQVPSTNDATLVFSGLALDVTQSADTFLLATVDVRAGATGLVAVSIDPAATQAKSATLGGTVKPSGAAIAGATLGTATTGTDGGTDSGSPDSGSPDAGAPDAGAPADEAEGGCGCQGTAAPGLVALAALLLAARRRRTMR